MSVTDASSKAPHAIGPIRVSKTVSFLPWQEAKPLRLIKFINRLAVAKSYIDYCTKTPYASVQFPHDTMEILSYAKVQYLYTSTAVLSRKYSSTDGKVLQFGYFQTEVYSLAYSSLEPRKLKFYTVKTGLS